jgi:hypothetical protein
VLTALEESSDDDGATSGTRGSMGSPTLRGCHMENTPALQTIMVTMWMVVPQPGMGLLPHQQQAYLEQQQAQVHARQIDAEWGATQHHDELANEQATLDAQIIELHRRKTALGMGQAAAIDYTKA